MTLIDVKSFQWYMGFFVLCVCFQRCFFCFPAVMFCFFNQVLSFVCGLEGFFLIGLIVIECC